MNTLKRLSSLLLTLILVLSFTACDSTSKAYIYFSLHEQPQTLDPQIAQTDTELMIIRNIFEGLLRIDQDGKIANGVAQSYEKKNLTYTFHLRADAQWSNEEPITADDFVFAFRRAVDPKTKAPFANRLSSITNAKDILKGEKSVESLGVRALDSHTLQIKLSQKDENFEKTLTTSIAMPCNEKFFYEAAGKYGIERETTLSNGSYRLAKWGKEVFGIRLYKNKFYKGDYEAKNAAVFFSIDKEREPVEVVAENEADIAFISPKDLSYAKQFELKTADCENICWFLTVSNEFSKDLRKSLISLATAEIFGQGLSEGYSGADSIYPASLVENPSATGMPVYDLENAKRLFKTEVEKLEDKKFPTDIVLYYYDDGFSKNVVTDIVGHWQNQLGAFVNIEAVSSPEVLQPQLIDQTYALTIFPVTANSSDTDEYLKKFGASQGNRSLSSIQKELLSSDNISPIMTQKTLIAYANDITALAFSENNGYIDFAYIIKEN